MKPKMINFEHVYGVAVHKLQNPSYTAREGGLRRFVLLHNFLRKFESQDDDVKKGEAVWLDSVLDGLVEEEDEDGGYVFITTKSNDVFRPYNEYNEYDEYKEYNKYEYDYMDLLHNNVEMEFEVQVAEDIMIPQDINPNEPNHFDPNLFDPNLFDPNHFDPSLFDPTHFDPTHFDPTHFDPTHFDPTHFDPTHFDPTHFDPGGVQRMEIDEDDEEDEDDEDVDTPSNSLIDSPIDSYGPHFEKTRLLSADNNINMLENAYGTLSHEDFHPYWKDNSIIALHL
ncbi:serine-repeat antigen SERA [Gigaspora margarita]|uniref:Serine-repeat antigen SERA n=1 Tax=Gigaspora margarita TaxID=4874 RepID=A0A8H3X5Q3_GIGMA|nr:serine-repeat antigen SERA [Gigaspora margarita]